MTSIREIRDAVTKFLTEDKWEYVLNETETTIAFAMEILGRMEEVTVYTEIQDGSYRMVTVYPRCCGKWEQPEVLDLMNRINRISKFGYFELDPDSGEIRYHVDVDCEDRLPTPAIIRNGLYCSLAYCEGCGDAFVKVIEGKATGRKAFETVGKLVSPGQKVTKITDWKKP